MHNTQLAIDELAARYAECNRQLHLERIKNAELMELIKEAKFFAEHHLDLIGAGEILRKKLEKFLNQNTNDNVPHNKN